MIIREELGLDFIVEKLDQDNEIMFQVEGGGDGVTSWLTIDETIKLIKFLQQEIDTFNKKMI